MPGSLREHLSYLCVYDLYRRSSSIIRRIVGSLTPIIDANFRNDALGHPKSALELFQRLRGSSQCVLSSDSSSLAHWNLRWIVLKPYILPQRHKRSLVSKESNYFRCSALSAKACDYRGFSITLRT